MMYLHAYCYQNCLMGFSFKAINNETMQLMYEYVMNWFANVFSSIRIHIFISINMGVDCSPPNEMY